MKNLILLLLVLGTNLNAQVKVINNTELDSIYLNDVISFASNKLLIDSIVIAVNPLDNNARLVATTDKAFVVHTFGNLYSIYIAPGLSDYNLTNAIIHELVHVKQMLDGKLTIYKDYVIYKKTMYNNSNSIYEERPYEIEADRNGLMLYKRWTKERKIELDLYARK